MHRLIESRLRSSTSRKGVESMQLSKMSVAREPAMTEGSYDGTEGPSLPDLVLEGIVIRAD
jgi:hypothetical protein